MYQIGDILVCGIVAPIVVTVPLMREVIVEGIGFQFVVATVIDFELDFVGTGIENIDSLVRGNISIGIASRSVVFRTSLFVMPGGVAVGVGGAVVIDGSLPKECRPDDPKTTLLVIVTGQGKGCGA